MSFLKFLRTPFGIVHLWLLLLDLPIFLDTDAFRVGICLPPEKMMVSFFILNKLTGRYYSGLVNRSVLLNN